MLILQENVMCTASVYVKDRLVRTVCYSVISLILKAFTPHHPEQLKDSFLETDNCTWLHRLLDATFQTEYKR